MTEQNRMTVRRFYHELWNGWKLELADEIVAEDLAFRGSLGASIRGRDGLKTYVQTIRAAFPDWHNEIDEMIAADDRVVTRMTWTGTHRGQFGNVAPTGTRVEYVGAAFFRLRSGVIEEAWVVGDSAAFWQAMKRPAS
jgi:steroid delta-isomerase-like uncharacterized protein